MTEALKRHQAALKAQWKAEQEVKVECGICRKVVFMEDSATCQTCGKVVCGGCGSITGNGPDNYEITCLECHVAEYDRR